MTILNLIRDKIQDYRHKRDYRKWVSSGMLIPPPHSVKQMTVKAYARIHGVTVLIETGTYLGEMVSAMKHVFNRVYSIELGDELYQKAEKKFSRNPHVSILHGDSTKVLPGILEQIKTPCLFWLDGHCSAGITAKGEKETSVIGELTHILSHPVKEHIILIDDARLFTGQNDYPTLEELQVLVLDTNPDHVLEVRDDIIRTHTKV